MKGERHAFQILRELGPECDRLGVRVVDARGGRTSASDFLDKIVLRIKCLEQQLQEADRGDGTRWIPVAERLPDRNVNVLVFIPSAEEQAFIASLDEGCMWFSNDPSADGYSLVQAFAPTHWMPLPAPPEMMQ